MNQRLFLQHLCYLIIANVWFASGRELGSLFLGIAFLILSFVCFYND